jgi:hypothetical protein
MVKNTFQLFLYILLSVIPGWGQSPNFPDSYLGLWNGPLEIFRGPVLIKSLDMEMEISRTEIDSIYNYSIRYIEPGRRDVRDYQIIVADKKNGKFIVDELNSIKLEMDLFANKLISSFEIEGSHIHFMYSLEADKIILEVISGSGIPAVFTGAEMEAPEVGIIRQNVYQKAVLTKK